MGGPCRYLTIFNFDGSSYLFSIQSSHKCAAILVLKSENVRQNKNLNISNEFFPSMLVILMTSLLEVQLKAVTVVLSVKQVEKAVGDRCETMFDNIY